MKIEVDYADYNFEHGIYDKTKFKLYEPGAYYLWELHLTKEDDIYYGEYDFRKYATFFHILVKIELGKTYKKDFFHITSWEELPVDVYENFITQLALENL